jgi:KUP system potassium uptake protein
VLLMRADTGGGGTLALMALVQTAVGRGRTLVILLGVIAAALFYGDAMLTPALSVLSAVEGLEIAAPSLDRFVLPTPWSSDRPLSSEPWHGQGRPVLRPDHDRLVHRHQRPRRSRCNQSTCSPLSPAYGIGFLAEHGEIGLVTLSVFLGAGAGRYASATGSARSRSPGCSSSCRH